MEPDANTSVERPNPTPTNPRSSKYDLRSSPKANPDDDYRYLTFNLSQNGLRIAYALFPEILGTCYETKLQNAYTFFKALKSFSERTIKH